MKILVLRCNFTWSGSAVSESRGCAVCRSKKRFRVAIAFYNILLGLQRTNTLCDNVRWFCQPSVLRSAHRHLADRRRFSGVLCAPAITRSNSFTEAGMSVSRVHDATQELSSRPCQGDLGFRARISIRKQRCESAPRPLY